LAVKAVIVHEQLSGGSEPWLITCDDDKKYVVKFFDEKLDKIVINEYVCHKIAMILVLTVPKAEIILIEQGLIDIINTSKGRKVKAGIHYGTLYIDPSSNLDPQNLQTLGIRTITNVAEVAGMIVFDIFVNNGDRSTTNALIAPINETTKEYKYLLMDHSHCFGGPQWNETTMINLPITQCGIPWKKEIITSLNDFTLYIKRLSIVKKNIKKIVDSMPSEWKIKPNDLKALVETIRKRDESEVIKLVKNMRGQFPNWSTGHE